MPKTAVAHLGQRAEKMPHLGALPKGEQMLDYKFRILIFQRLVAVDELRLSVRFFELFKPCGKALVGHFMQSFSAYHRSLPLDFIFIVVYKITNKGKIKPDLS